MTSPSSSRIRKRSFGSPAQLVYDVSSLQQTVNSLQQQLSLTLQHNEQNESQRRSAAEAAMACARSMVSTLQTHGKLEHQINAFDRYMRME